MDACKLTNVLRKYKKCPGCGSSWKDTKLKSKLDNEIITIYCECGFEKNVDENNKEIK
ncbi:MAG: DUF3797 domain-containing protein [Peptostreptococcaceae bacterium]